MQAAVLIVSFVRSNVLPDAFVARARSGVVEVTLEFL